MRALFCLFIVTPFYGLRNHAPKDESISVIECQQVNLQLCKDRLDELSDKLSQFQDELSTLRDEIGTIENKIKKEEDEIQAMQKRILNNCGTMIKRNDKNKNKNKNDTNDDENEEDDNDNDDNPFVSQQRSLFESSKNVKQIEQESQRQKEPELERQGQRKEREMERQRERDRDSKALIDMNGTARGSKKDVDDDEDGGKDDNTENVNEVGDENDYNNDDNESETTENRRHLQKGKDLNEKLPHQREKEKEREQERKDDDREVDVNDTNDASDVSPDSVKTVAVKQNGSLHEIGDSEPDAIVEDRKREETFVEEFNDESELKKKVEQCVSNDIIDQPCECPPSDEFTNYNNKKLTSQINNLKELLSQCKSENIGLMKPRATSIENLKLDVSNHKKAIDSCRKEIQESIQKYKKCKKMLDDTKDKYYQLLDGEKHN